MVLRALPVRAAGGIVVRDGDARNAGARDAGAGSCEVALVYRSSHSDWSFPKGKLEPGETELFCARREVEEETGLLCNIGAYVGETGYVDRRGRQKTVHYWLMEPLAGEFRPGCEIDDMQWVPIGLAHHVLTYGHDRRLLEKATRTVLAEVSPASRSVAALL